MISALRDHGVSQARPGWHTIVALLLFAALLGLLAIRFLGWATGVVDTVAYPDQIDYGEGIIWQQADLILSGKGYKNIASLPHIVFHYPPVFHLTSGLLAAALGIDQLASGRLISTLSTLGILTLIGLLVHRAVPNTQSTLVRGACASIAGLIALNFRPLAVWSQIDRVDMLAIGLSLLGALFALWAVGRQRNAVVAALFFVLAIFTKQTMIAAPVAAFVALLLVRPRAAWLGFVAAAVFGLAALVPLQIMTGGGFLRHIVGYNINRIDLSIIDLIAPQIVRHPIFIALAFFSATRIILHPHTRPAGISWLATLKHDLSGNPVRQMELFSVCYLAFTTLSLVAIFKSGASSNYLIEWMCACGIQVGLFLRKPIALALAAFDISAAEKPEIVTNASISNRLRLPLIPALLIMQIQLLPAPVLAGSGTTEQFETLTAMIGHSSRPVISDNMVAVMRAGKDLFLETAIIAELTAMGNWDETAFLAQIRNHEFGFFVTQDSPGESLFKARYSPAVRQAIERYYSRTERLAGYTLRFPPPDGST